MSEPTRSTYLRYGIALLAVVVAIGVLFIPRIGGQLGLTLFFAVLLSAWYGGLGPGVFATGLIILFALVWESLIARTFAPVKLASWSLFVLFGVLIAALVEALHQARWRAEASAAEARRHEEAVREADRRKDEFLATLAHELRNPLAAISAGAQLLRESPDEDDARWSREVIERQTAHLARLIDDLLDVSRISQGRIRLRKSLVDAADVVERACAAVRPLVQDRGQDFTLDSEPGALLLDADPTRLEQILVNLLSNAAKYTERGGRIVLETRREGPEIAFTVRDSGIGIAPEALARVFDLFFQADAAPDRTRGGLGIGLSLVRRLVELHGGRVEARSPGSGQGSEFTVRLPASAASSAADPDAEAVPCAEIHGIGPT
jgi:signal transduction histidine kinase